MPDVSDDKVMGEGNGCFYKGLTDTTAENDSHPVKMLLSVFVPLLWPMCVIREGQQPAPGTDIEEVCVCRMRKLHLDSLIIPVSSLLEEGLQGKSIP